MPLYPENRLPTGTLLQQTQTMLSTGSNPTLVANFLQQQNCKVKPRDVCNLKQKLQFPGTPMQEIDNALNHPETHYEISKDDNDQLQGISFCTEHQKQLASAYGGVILMDGTYRINKYRIRMPLYTLTVVDSEGHGQPIAHALVTREDTAHLTWFLRTATKWFPDMTASVFVVDKDYTEINAIKEVFPDTAIHLCRFHILKAFMEEMKRQSVQNDRHLYQVIV